MKAIALILTVPLFCCVLSRGVVVAQKTKTVNVMSQNINGCKTMHLKVTTQACRVNYKLGGTRMTAKD